MDSGSAIKHDISKAPKTGDWRYVAPVVDKKKCIGCGTCVKFCPEACIELVESQNPASPSQGRSKIASIDYEWCKGCGVCVTVCPVKAIIMSAQGGSASSGKK